MRCLCDNGGYKAITRDKTEPETKIKKIPIPEGGVPSLAEFITK